MNLFLAFLVLMLQSNCCLPLPLPPSNPPVRMWFTPNQLGANLWYKPEGSVINGHLNGSFTNFSLWPLLSSFLSNSSGGLGIYAAELAFLSSSQLYNFQTSAGLAIQAEDPTFTQCLPSNVISDLALFGKSPPGQDLFCSIFLLCDTLRPNSTNLGWYLSSEGNNFTPDSIVLDERMPNLLIKPSSNPAQMAQLWNSSLSWDERKESSFQDPCPAMNNFRPNITDRVSSIIADYVDFGKAINVRFGNTSTSFGLHWNVIAWWEWLDIQCLDDLNSLYPNVTDFKNALLGITNPCHRDTDHLISLVSSLCRNMTCPEAVYMDIDYLYDTAYALDVLSRNKAALINLSIPFGINIVDECNTAEACLIVDTGDKLEAQTQQMPYNPNKLHEMSLIAMYGFFVRKGIIDSETRIRVASWSVRPHEIDSFVDERLVGSMAHTANQIFLGK